MQRRQLLAAAGALALCSAASLPAFAQDAYPNKPIRLIVPFPPSGGTDVLSRAIAQAISTETSWNFVVDNRPGAGGNIGLEAAAKSPPDGYTIAMGQTSNLAVNPALYSKMPFDPLKDFAPIMLVSSQPLIVVVTTASPYKTFKDLIDASKAQPGALNICSAGNGTIGHIAGELFQRRAGVKWQHVPVQGRGPAITDMLGGSVHIFFGNTQSVGGQIAGGKLRPLAVTSPRRLAHLPDVPTVAELGYPGFEAATWSGLVAPAGTSPAIIERLNAEAAKALKSATMTKKLEDDGSTPLGGTPQQFAEFIRAEHAKWGAAVRDAGIKLD
jgi:tripartite-type tricarboxylate transporter receptor subunit TctC